MSQAASQESGPTLELDPIIDALLEHLPAPGDYWAKDERKRWLAMIELAFDMIYDDQPPEQGDAMHPHGNQT
jgi:hypothetical protein